MISATVKLWGTQIGAVERLLYTGQRGMGALEYEPVSEIALEYKESVDLQKLVKCAADVLTLKENLHFKSDENEISYCISAENYNFSYQY